MKTFLKDNKVKVRISYFLIIILLSIGVKNVYFPSQDQIQKSFRSECEVIIDRLIAQRWQGDSGLKILNSRKDIILKFDLPEMVRSGNRISHKYRYFWTGGEGMFVVGPPKVIIISLYPKRRLEGNSILSYGGYGIDRDELIHVLIDELVSASMGGEQFVDGEASCQEEREAWELAEDALDFFHGKDIVIPASFSPPVYGVDNKNYISVLNYLKYE